MEVVETSTVSLQPVLRAYEQVADQLRTLIFSGALLPGARLPQEADLAAQFGVSRPTVREALRALAAQGLLRTSKGPGGGNFITLPTVTNISELVESGLALMTEARGVTLQEFLEAREILETRAARLAAERRSPEQLQRLYEAIPDQPLRLTTPDQFKHNRDFHAEILTASGNTLLYLAAQPIFTVLQNNLERSKMGVKVHRGINDQHRGLAAAIEAGDGDAAEQLMREHLDHLRPAYERAWLK